MSSTDELLSVIVPACNAREWLSQYLGSIIGWAYRNLELIVVDDASTDGTGDLCDAYAMRDSRVRVIHTLNGGPGLARKKGLECAETPRWYLPHFKKQRCDAKLLAMLLTGIA